MITIFKLNRILFNLILLIPFVSYVAGINSSLIDRILFISILTSTLALYFKKSGSVILRIFVIFCTYVAISVFLFRFYGFDKALLTPSLYFIIIGPLFVKWGVHAPYRVILVFSFLLILVTLYELNLLWLSNGAVEYFNHVISLGYGREALPHYGPIYIPLGVLFDHHTTSWVYFILSLYFFNRNLLLAIGLGLLGILHFSLTNLVVYVLCILFSIFSISLRGDFKEKFILISGLIILITAIFKFDFDTFVLAKSKSDNLDSFYKWTNLDNFINSLDALVLGHGGLMNYEIIRSEISLVKILYALGLPLLVLTIINYFEVFKSYWNNSKVLITYFLLTLVHYGVSFRFVPFFIFISIIGSDTSKYK